jgi:hypothetical protein
MQYSVSSALMLILHFVISPILFNIYVKDLFETIVSQRCKFADDGTMWKSGNNLVEVSDCIQ